jgi:hypothetical protein
MPFLRELVLEEPSCPKLQIKMTSPKVDQLFGRRHDLIKEVRGLARFN